jgi:GPH family glycoside/pentoside/hexuronide:cation symporter
MNSKNKFQCIFAGMQEGFFPIRKQIAYGFGMMGWSIMINLISVILVYLYVPPSNSGLPLVISQVVIFGIFNIISIITAGGRLVDAAIDPLIAQLSDRSRNPKGRRTPLMKKAILPSLVFCCLVFYPLRQFISPLNTAWLAFTLAGFYVSTTLYVIPYNALLPELAPRSQDKVRLSTWQSVGYVFGIGIASNAFNITDLLQHSFGALSRLGALQYTVFLLALLAALCMAVAAWSIDEKKYAVGKPSSVPLGKALRQTLGNRNFRFFIVADFSYFMGVTIISSGLLYFVTVLLRLPDTIGNKLMITMVLVSFIFYPVVNFLSARIGKKSIVIFSLLLLSLVFAGIYFLGRPAIDPRLQIYSLIIVASIPVASLNILPVAILAEIISKDTLETGSNKEAIYFAVRYFFVKIAQTFGIALFAMFLVQGKDIGHDAGIRMNGILGFVLCLTAAIIFLGFKEDREPA